MNKRIAVLAGDGIEAKKPLILAGAGVLHAQAANDLLTYVEQQQIPVTNTLLGLGSFPGEHDLFLGMAGMHGTYTANISIYETDLLINIGARFDDRLTGNLAHFAPHAKVVHIDIDPAEIGKNVHVDIPVYIDIIPGHMHLNKFAEVAKEAIREAGGIPFEFNTIGVDDGIAMGHIGMRYSLPSREIICDAAETVINAHWFDGVFYIPNCDKITPGMLMAAVRTNVPAVFVSGGPMEAGKTKDGTRTFWYGFFI